MEKLVQAKTFSIWKDGEGFKICSSKGVKVLKIERLLTILVEYGNLRINEEGKGVLKIYKTPKDEELEDDEELEYSQNIWDYCDATENDLPNNIWE